MCVLSDRASKKPKDIQFTDIKQKKAAKPHILGARTIKIDS